MFSRVISILASLAIAIPAFAQFERVLIPSVANEPVAGVNGSSWITEIDGQNLGDAIMTLNLPVCPIFECHFRELQPKERFSGPVAFTTSPHGAVVQIRSTSLGYLALVARARDLSRALDTWGTELPVVREHEVLTTPITLLNLPNSDRFRVTIRMYDFTWDENEFLVTLTSLQGKVLAERRIASQLLRDNNQQYQGLAFAVVTDLDVKGVDALNVTIATASHAQFWAFASVTNNETQHVTVVSPNRVR